MSKNKSRFVSFAIFMVFYEAAVEINPLLSVVLVADQAASRRAPSPFYACSSWRDVHAGTR